MTDFITINNLEFLHICDEHGNLRYGADQLWYEDSWKRKAGCGPTTCSNIFAYLYRRNAKDNGPVSETIYTKKELADLMHEMWYYTTPGKMGLNSTRMFANGAEKYGQAHGLNVQCQEIGVQKFINKRPAADELAHVIIESIRNNAPVAFLNLSNGKVKILEPWHWVTVVGFDSNSTQALIYDNGSKYQIDIKLWLETTALGGGFVSISLK